VDGAGEAADEMCAGEGADCSPRPPPRRRLRPPAAGDGAADCGGRLESDWFPRRDIVAGERF